MAWSPEILGLAMLGTAEVPQVMSAFLPSPSTARAKGGDPDQIRWLRRGEVIGSAVSIGIAGSITLVAYRSVGSQALMIIGGAVIVLGLFLWEYEHAIQEGISEGQHDDGHGY